MQLNISLLTRGRREHRQRVLQVVPDADRCMQCGLCSYNCPAGIDVRAYAWEGVPVTDSHCLACGICVSVCPRSGLSLEQSDKHARIRN
jgi:Pyruvate/2-oxoacid:ferredoxin oxidoreductase delta subunit